MPSSSRYEIFRDDGNLYRRVAPRRGLLWGAGIFLALVAAGNIWWFTTALTNPARVDDREEARRLSALSGPAMERIETRTEEIVRGLERLKAGEATLRAIISLDKDAVRAAQSAPGAKDAVEDPREIQARMEMRAAFVQALNRPVKLAVANGEAVMRLIPQGSVPLGAAPDAWPVRGVVSSEFGARLSPFAGQEEFHKGVDIMAPAGSPVTAPAPGVVTFAGKDAEGTLALILDHGGGYATYFSHLQRLDVQAGAPVARGSLLASVGSEGRSTGPHLHYEVRLFGVPVNPASYLGQALRQAQP